MKSKREKIAAFLEILLDDPTDANTFKVVLDGLTRLAEPEKRPLAWKDDDYSAAKERWIAR